MNRVIAKEIGRVLLALAIAIFFVPTFIQTSYAANGTLSGDGTVDSPFMIEDAQDLVQMATDVNAGTNAASYYKLAQDIDLSDVCGEDLGSWTPIGNSNSMSFQGTFDGDGHKIKGLYINVATGYQGLFGYAKGATLKNFILQGTVTSTSGADNAGVLAYATTPITLENVGNEADVSAAGNNAGGLLSYLYYGSGTNTISSCYNKGNITTSGNDAGGIIGYIYQDVNIENCYNTGAIASTTTNQARAGGLVSYSSYSTVNIQNSFNYGSTTGTTNGAITAYTSGGTVTVSNCYYLENSGSGTDGATAKTASEFKALAAQLGEAWIQGDDYPMLPFEYIKGKAFVDGATPARQQVTQGEAAEELAVTVTGDSKLQPSEYTLSNQWYQATQSDLSDATAIEGATDTTFTPEIAADMTPGAYYYYCVVTSKSTNGAFTDVTTGSSAARIDVVSTIEAATPTITISKDLETSSVGQGNTVNFTAEGAVSGEGAGTLSYEWYVADSKNLDPENDSKVGTGETYEFKADDLGVVYIYCVATNTFENVKTATAKSKAIKLTVVGKEIATAAELVAFAEDVNGGATYEGRAVTVTEDIDLTEVEWTPIGTSSSVSFKGTFDGDGHVISGLMINGTTSGQGLFKYINGATIKNLVVKGTISSPAGYVGAITAYSYGTSVIENVGNEATVTGTSNVGGLVGSVSSGSLTVKNSYNKGAVEGTSRVGGIIGYGGYTGSGNIISCYNAGAVTTQATSRYNTYAGGLCGGNYKIENSYNVGNVLHPAYSGTDSYAFSLVGNTSAPTTASPCYWMTGTAGAACGGTNTNIIEQSAEEMAAEAFVGTLNVGNYAGTWIAGAHVEARAQNYPALKWEGVKNTVTFVLNDGTEDTIVKKVVSGEKVAKPNDPEQAGGFFIEWQEYDEAFDFDTAIIIGNVTLTAKWYLLADTKAKLDALSSTENLQLYREAEQALVLAAIQEGKTSIDAAESIEEAEAALKDALDVIDKIKTDEELTEIEAAELRGAKANANDVIDKAVADAKGIVNNDENSSTAIDAKATAAKTAIDEATDMDAVSEALAGGVADIYDITITFTEGVAAEAAATLATAKETAIQQILTTITENNLSGEEVSQAAIQAIIAISGAKSVEEVETALQAGLAAFDEIPPVEPEVEMVEFEKAKASACDMIDGAVADAKKAVANDKTASAAIDAKATEAKTTIGKAADLDAVTVALVSAVADIYAITNTYTESVAGEAAATLATAKETAIQQILSAIDDNNLSGEEASQAAIQAIVAISGAKSTTEVEAALQTGLAAIGEIQPPEPPVEMVELEKAKTSACGVIDDAVANAKKTVANDETASAAIDAKAAAAKTAVGEAKDLDAVTAILAKAVADIYDITVAYTEEATAGEAAAAAAALATAKETAIQEILSTIETNGLTGVTASQIAMQAIVEISGANNEKAINEAKARAGEDFNVLIEAQAKEVTGFKVKAKKGKKAIVKWQVAEGVTGYEIYRSTKKDGTYKMVKSINKATAKKFVNKRLKAKKAYFYKMRPYTTVTSRDGQTEKIYGQYTEAKRIKAKK